MRLLKMQRQLKNDLKATIKKQTVIPWSKTGVFPACRSNELNAACNDAATAPMGSRNNKFFDKLKAPFRELFHS